MDSLSGGQKTSVFLAGIAIHRPDIVLLDEPTNHLDLEGRILCSLTISNQSPDLIVLDEPTNNLDIQNIEILTAAINEYKGTLLVIAHDEYFLDDIHVEHAIHL
ncbi:ABC transporter [Pedobacter terrae]|uniref:ABC transporter n=2 Tax=Pedobacter terrae TaxID=405671 RepID=A0A1G7R997_9SPHI|nr:ABC transporter [Pedobacter terrae]